MAILAKSLPFFFFFLLFSLQTLARDLRSFSKITRESDLDQEKVDQQPAFLPQTGRDAYGLYARHSDSLSPSSAAKTSDQPLYNPQSNMEEFEAAPATANTNHHHKNYAAELQGLGGTTNNGDSYFNEENLGARFVEDGRDGYGVNNQKQVNINNGYQGGYGQPEYYDNKGYYRGGAQDSGRYYETNSYSGTRGDQTMEEAEEFQFDP